jgi:large subunit ribosomal protein L6
MSVAISTSRIGRKPINIPSGVEVKMKDGVMSIKGSKGLLSVDLHPYVNVTMEGGEIKVHPSTDADHVITGKRIKLYRSIAGTVRANIFNAVHGVSQGFERALQLVGVGYKAQAKGKVLSLSLGYSHPTDFSVPEGIVIETPSPTDILVKGVDKELVGLVAANIRKIRGPEPYKGKGVRYANEVIEIKETKKK